MNSGIGHIQITPQQLYEIKSSTDQLYETFENAISRLKLMFIDIGEFIESNYKGIKSIQMNKPNSCEINDEEKPSSQSILDQVEKCKIYYQEFHHKIITWHITISGFIFAALIAAKPVEINYQLRAIGFTILFAIISTAASSLLTIITYSKRISNLNKYLSDNYVPVEWKSKHKEGGSIEGEGTKYFFILIIALFIINFFILMTQIPSLYSLFF